MPPSNEDMNDRLGKLELKFEQKVESNNPSKPGLMLRVDRLEQADASRGRNLRWLTGGSFAGLLGLLYWLFGRGGNGP